MRPIYGTPDKPNSEHILIIRGIDLDSLTYFRMHKDKYPTWGCIIVREEGQIEHHCAVRDKDNTSIHQVITDMDFQCRSDYAIVTRLLKKFPKYSDSDDPLIEEESTESSISKALGLGSMLKDLPPLEVRDFPPPTHTARPIPTHGLLYHASARITREQLHFSRDPDGIKSMTIEKLRREICDKFIKDDSLWLQDETFGMDGSLCINVRFATPVHKVE